MPEEAKWTGEERFAAKQRHDNKEAVSGAAGRAAYGKTGGFCRAEAAWTDAKQAE